MALLRLILMGGLILLAVTVIAVGAALHGHSTGWIAEKRSLAEHAAFLEPHLTVTRPDTADPAPVMLIFSGCGGVRPHHETWANLAADEGFIAVIVDSMAPRGMSRDAALTQVCSGSRLWGRERAGDVMAAIAQVQTIEGADPSRVVLFGQSHGGWAIMDLLSMDFAQRAPTGLWPRPDPAFLGAVQGVVLFYPYCGAFSLTQTHGWSVEPPALMVLADDDTVVSPLACREAADALKSAGVPIVVDSYAGAGHAFDEVDRAPEPGFAPNPERTEEARARVRRFLRFVKGD